MPRRSLPLRALIVASVAALGALAAPLFGGCSNSDDPRRGGPGETCTRTDDCTAPLACVAGVCVDPNAGTGGSGSGTGGGTPNVGGQGPSADAGPWSTCDECLDKACATELTACDDDCVAVEACIEMLCSNLSEIGSADEGKCQVECQNLHPGAKTPHLDVVNCAQSATCSPPCTFYPQDYDACRQFMNEGDCKPARVACEDSVDCTTYRDCVGQCTTLKDCLACDDTAESTAGRKLLEAYETCVASECISESWIPKF